MGCNSKQRGILPTTNVENNKQYFFYGSSKEDSVILGPQVSEKRFNKANVAAPVWAFTTNMKLHGNTCVQCGIIDLV